MADDKPEGLKEPGNIDLTDRPMVANPDGTYSSEKSFSRGTDKGEVLVPSIVNGKTLSQDDAWKHYQKSGEHMGIFDTPDHADAYADKVHNRKLGIEGEAATHTPISHAKIPYALARQARKK
jgi:hypothetical protein